MINHILLKLADWDSDWIWKLCSSVYEISEVCSSAIKNKLLIRDSKVNLGDNQWKQ